MQLYIRRNGEQFGPYSREAVIEYLKQDIFRDHDEGCYAGTPEWRPLRELLGVRTDRPLGKGIELSETRKITAFNPNWTGPRAEPQVARESRSNVGMIAVAALSALIVLGFVAIRLAGGADRVRELFASLAAHSSGQAVVASPTPAASSEIFSTPAPMPIVAATPSATPVPVASIAPVASPSPAEVAATSPTPSTIDENIPQVTPPDITVTLVGPGSTPVLRATPSQPSPTPFDPVALAANPNAWPRTLHLADSVDFPVVMNSQVIGSITAPAGAEVTLLKIKGQQVTVSFNGGTKEISWHLTDLEDQASKIVTAQPSPTAPPDNQGDIPIPPH
jgi:hypothetical protein